MSLDAANLFLWSLSYFKEWLRLKVVCSRFGIDEVGLGDVLFVFFFLKCLGRSTYGWGTGNPVLDRKISLQLYIREGIQTSLSGLPGI